MVKIKAKGKTGLSIAWEKVDKASGYDVFFTRCGHDRSCKKVKTIKGNKTFKWIKTGLKKETAYKAYVKAYFTEKGKKVYVKTSPLMRAYTGGSTKNYTNARSVKLNRTKVTLKAGKSFRIKARVVKLNKSKKLMPDKHTPKLRYMTTDSKIATVSKSGKIEAKGSGTCKIYVFAHNGVSKKINVTVK